LVSIISIADLTESIFSIDSLSISIPNSSSTSKMTSTKLAELIFKSFIKSVPSERFLKAS
jgi:hypothetical protein